MSALLTKAFSSDLYPKEGKQQALSIYEKLLFAKYIDEKMAKMIRQNKGGTFHLSTRGHELVGVLAGSFLNPGVDWAFPYYRDRSFVIGLGLCMKELFAALLAKESPHHSGGRMMPEHFSHKPFRIPCQSSCVGSQFLQAVGTAKGIRLRKAREMVYVSAGEGATSQGDFHEALNFSCLHQLPILFVIQDNGWAISVPVEEQTAGKTIAKIARGYENLQVWETKGWEYEPCSAVFQQAVSYVREKQSPGLIVAKVSRIGPHSSSDDPQKYKTKKDLQEDLQKDPIACMEAFLQEKQKVPLEKLQRYQEEVKEKVELAAKQAEALPFPKSQTAFTKVYHPVPKKEASPCNPISTESIVMMDALNHALQEEMEKDPGVLVFGQDVAHGKGGVFGITRQLTERFGEDRCFNTPLAESTIVGIATGLSLDGFHKPVAEIQFCDYSWTAMNQIVNELSSMYYRSNGEWSCPVVIRMPYGGYIQGGPYHSQSIESYLCHTPGLKVVIPSNAEDAKRLLKASIRDPNPVIFLEHKALYRQRVFCARKEPSKEEWLELGKAHIVRSGEDLTFLGWGMLVPMGIQMAEQLHKEGISVEVIDLRTLQPLDKKTLLDSVKKTGKVLIAQEAAKTGGFGAELAAQIGEEAFTYLDAPIHRVGAKDCPVPYGKNLEEAVLPQLSDLIQAAKELSAF